MLKNQFLSSAPITPVFPNWEKSFVSGTNSPLYKVVHHLTAAPIELITHVNFKDAAEGPPGHIHGGASAGLIDETMGVLVWNQNYPCVTQHLNLHYLKPIPLNMDSYVLTSITSVSVKTVEVKSSIFNAERIPYVQANSVFHLLTPEQYQRFITQCRGSFVKE